MKVKADYTQWVAERIVEVEREFDSPISSVLSSVIPAKAGIYAVI